MICIRPNEQETARMVFFSFILGAALLILCTNAFAADVTVTLTTDKAVYGMEEVVNAHLVIENRGTQPIPLLNLMTEIVWISPTGERVQKFFGDPRIRGQEPAGPNIDIPASATVPADMFLGVIYNTTAYPREQGTYEIAMTEPQLKIASNVVKIELKPGVESPNDKPLPFTWPADYTVEYLEHYETGDLPGSPIARSEGTVAVSGRKTYVKCRIGFEGLPISEPLTYINEAPMPVPLFNTEGKWERVEVETINGVPTVLYKQISSGGYPQMGVSNTSPSVLHVWLSASTNEPVLVTDFDGKELDGKGYKRRLEIKKFTAGSVDHSLFK